MIFLTLDACHFKVIVKVNVKVLSAMRPGIPHSILKFWNDLPGSFSGFVENSFPSRPRRIIIIRIWT